MASRLIPLHKDEDTVRPMGVGKVIRRVCEKCVMMVETGGSLQPCANAFNAFNRAAAFYNIRVLCLVISAYAISTYRQPARLLITSGKKIVSAEGTPQGDPLAFGLYALSIEPSISSLNHLPV